MFSPCDTLKLRGILMKNLVNLRKAKGLSQQKLGKEIGLARNTICQYESGNRVPDVDTLIKIAQYFNISVDYLLGLTDSLYTAEDYANGVKDTKKISITADEEEILDKSREIIDKLGTNGKDLIIEFFDIIIKKFNN